MALFRGTGGSGDASTDTYASEVALEARTASTKANEAAASATSAATAQAAAEVAQAAAETAQTNAETAETNAETAETNAETAENAAVAAQTAATTAKTAAETAQSAAEVAKTAAETAETNAETAETNASASAATATTKATEAATSATSASTFATSASTSATNAATSATAAQTAQTAAEAAQTAAEAAQEAIDGLYLGTATSNPTVDLNGNAVTAGDWYFNTTDNTTRIYDGSTWNSINPDLVGDASPQLGGNLDLNSNDITGTGNVNITGNVTLSGTVDGRDVAADGTKLDGIESGATADQTAAEIRTLVESATDSNVFTDADHTKLNGIEASADVTDTTNVTAAGALMDSEVTNLAQVKAFSSADYATAAQGTLADSALQSGDNISVLTNNSGYITGNETITLSGAVTGSGTTSITTTLSTVDGGTWLMTTIKLKNGSGAPTAGDLVQGEPALDLTNKRLYTEDSGGTVIEVGTNPGTDVTFADNRKAIFGAGSDLQIYHDGSNSYITDSGTGNLRISGTLLQLNDASFNKYLLGSGDSVTLYNADSAKLATTSTGIDVTGTVTADGLTVDGNATIGQTSASDRTLSIGFCWRNSL